MPERIYTFAGDGTLEALEETQFSTEDELQALIAEHPELLDGGQILPGDARRWIVVTREKGIAASAGEAARWSVDHLIIDQDAVPTLVEVKRGSNREIRRSIVGQLLEYAAHASETWTAGELRGMFERQSEARGGDAESELATLLQTDDDPDPDMDRFWEDVSTNLAANRMRLLFVADFIPDPLVRVIEFLNAQMPNVEVLAVEIKRFHGTSARTLVPRVIGRTAAGTRTPGRAGLRLTRETFLAGFGDDAVRGVAERLLDAAMRLDADVWYGRTFGISVRANNPAWPRPITVAWLYSEPGKKGWMRTRDFSFGMALDGTDLPETSRAVLERWVDEFSADNFTENVSSKSVKAWAVSHDVSVQQQDVMVERLRRILSELASQ